MEVNIGLSENDRVEIAQGLSKVLADSYTLYLKTHNFHWNVTGPMFSTLHNMFEIQYTELATAIDGIAERIRALGVFAPASYKQFSELTTIQEEVGNPAATEMIKQLVLGHEEVAKSARPVVERADNASDNATADLLIARIQTHEKTAWMLRSLLEN